MADPERTELRPALRAYLERLPELVAASRPSVFWEQQLRRQRPRYERGAKLDRTSLAALVRELGYGFEELPPDVATAKGDPDFKAALAAVRRVRTVDAQPAPRALGLEERSWRHMRALHFLRKERLLDEYVAFLAPLRIRSSLDVARHWYYARQIAGLADETVGSGRLDVLEIGAGAGNLAYFLTRMGRVRSYCIVDLPELLAHSGYTLDAYLPARAPLVFDDPKAVARKGAYVLLPANRARELPKRSFDLVLNLNSFMEMDEADRDAYIRLAYRAGREGALFFNVNRRQRTLPTRDGGTWDNNPLLYPYRRDDRVLVWEEDPFQTVTRSKWGGSVSLTITRAAVMRPASAPASPAPPAAAAAS